MTIRGKDKNSPPFHDDKHHIDKKVEKQMLKNTWQSKEWFALKVEYRNIAHVNDGK